MSVGITRWWEIEPWQHRDQATSTQSSTRSRGIDEARMRLSCHEVSHCLRFQEAGAEAERITVNTRSNATRFAGGLLPPQALRRRRAR